MESVDNALVGESRLSYFPLDDFDIGVQEGLLQPDTLAVKDLLPKYLRLFNDGGLYMGDLLWAASPLWGLPWMEAIVGCQVEVRKGDTSIWSKQRYDEIREVPDIKFSEENLWFQKLIEFVEALSIQGMGRYPLASPLMRGPVDILAALIGHENLALAAYDTPKLVQKLAEQCAELFTNVAKTQLEIMTDFHGGYSQHQQIWAPGFTVMTQQDAALFFTPDNYGRLILPADRMILKNFAYSIMHFHSTALHTLDDFLDMDELECVQVVIDPMGPSLNNLLPIFSRIQENKPLVIFADLDSKQLDFVLTNLSSRGLCVYNKPADVKKSTYMNDSLEVFGSQIYETER